MFLLWLFLLCGGLGFAFSFEVGRSPGFLAASEYLKSTMNLSVNPCDDFYQFSCGNWIAHHPIPPELSKYVVFDHISTKVENDVRELLESSGNPDDSRSIKMVKRMFEECIDVEKINRIGPEMLMEETEKFGYWPMVHRNLWNSAEYNLTHLIIHLATSRNYYALFHPIVDVNSENVTEHVIKFSSVDKLPLAREYYLDTNTYSTQIEAYRNSLIAKTKAFIEEANLLVHVSEIENDVDEVLQFETKLAAIMLSMVDTEDVKNRNNARPFSYLQKTMPLIDWARLMSAVMPASTISYLKSNSTIVIEDLDYFPRLYNLLRSTDPRIVTNFAMLGYSSTWSMLLGERFEDITQTFNAIVFGKSTQTPRWRRCLTPSNRNVLMIYAIDLLYVKKHFTEKSRAAVAEMIENLQGAIAELLEQNDWMDTETKKEALIKSSAMAAIVGYTEMISDARKVDAYYRKLHFGIDDSYVEMTTKSHKFIRTVEFEKLGKPVDRYNEVDMRMAEVNAMYDPTKNTIFFPAAILQPPMFDVNFPSYLNYGCIGPVIGHEITHGFDNEGSEYDSTGKLLKWMSEKSLETLSAKTNCLVEQYGNIEVPGTNKTINGNLTLGENIADNGGIKGAFMAYKKFLKKNGPEKRLPSFEMFANDQMFYIGYAQFWCGQATQQDTLESLLSDYHSPEESRVNVVLGNQPEFSSAFNCPLGSPMNPEKKCAVW